MPKRRYVGMSSDNHFSVASMSDKPTRIRRNPLDSATALFREASIRDAIRAGRRSGWLRNKALLDTESPSSKTGEDPWYPEALDTEHPPIGPGPMLADGSRPSDLFARTCREIQNAEKRKKTQDQWLKLEPVMSVTYLELQRKTLNWTSGVIYEEGLVRCLEANTCITRNRVVDLVDLTSRQRKTLKFCACHSDPVHLLRLGYVAGSPHQPRTGFSIQLVQFYNNLWKLSTISSSKFIDALMRHLHTRAHEFLNSQNQDLQDRNLGAPFKACVRFFRKMEQHHQEIFDDAFQFTPIEILANKCSSCFGPSLGEQKLSENDPHVIIALDGNFQHQHQAHSSKDNPSDHLYPINFLTPPEVLKHQIACNITDAQAKALKSSCSESHTAASNTTTGTKKGRDDDSGIFACTCRHDIPLLFVNIYRSGEKLHYPIALLDRLMSNLPGKRIGILYDIGCHLETHIHKRNLLAAYTSQMMFGTSVFHSYVHDWACQMKYNPRFNESWGLSDGECLERLWSFLPPLVSTLRISTRLQRLLSIHWRAEFYSTELKRRAARWLRRKYDNAITVARDSGKSLNLLYRRPNPSIPGSLYTENFFRQQWSAEKNAPKNKDEVQETLRLELGRLLCLKGRLNEIWNSTSSTPEQALARLETSESLEKEISAQIAKIGSAGFTDFENSGEQEAFLKLWYCKRDLRMKYIDICETKRPLNCSRRDGQHSNLGTRGIMHLLKTLRKQASRLVACLTSYQTELDTYRIKFPNQPHPPSITHEELLNADADHPFWNDGLFTNSGEPWAVDAETRHGMRQLAYQDRAREELRRLRWEARRCMRWATQMHKRLFEAMNTLDFTHAPGCESVARLLNHPSMATLKDEGKITTAAKVLISTRLRQHLRLQEQWSADLVQVLNLTGPQDGDCELMEIWSSQMDTIKRLHIYSCLSNMDGYFVGEFFTSSKLQVIHPALGGLTTKEVNMQAGEEDEEEREDDNTDDEETNWEDEVHIDPTLENFIGEKNIPM